ncbi:hypothetical protein [Thermobaculum terrenum]|uniref:hypothetical protein n=1 Tax=Thermobaculum terrenum TaxID=166501 RepID=UPI00019BEDD0|nr:hypothetical protein [Thermobaculum terrenum]
MIIRGKSEMGEAEIIEHAMKYFIGDHNLEVVSQTVNAISFSGSKGTVNITVDEQGPDSEVQIITEGLEAESKAFLQSVAYEVTQGETSS